MTVSTLLQTLNRHGLISQIHGMLSQKDCPLLFLTLTLQLLHNLTQMDYKKAIPVLTQLDYWTFLVELLDIESLTHIERTETRPVIKALLQSGTINCRDPCTNLDLVYMSVNSILDFLFEAFKRDSQLAGLLVKTTKLMQSVFFLLSHTLDRFRNDVQSLKLSNKGLLTVFVDKVVKVMHVALLHPQDYSVDVISKFLFLQPLNSDESSPLPRNWLYVIDMFTITEQFGQTMDLTDIKLALIRFVTEFLIQTAHFTNNFLDELVNVDCQVLQESSTIKYQAELDTYGSLLFFEFAKVFKTLYVDMRGNPSETENQQKDIAMCLQVLLASSQSAKTQAVDQNFLKKVIDICAENASAIYLSELQKFSEKGKKKSASQAMFDQQLNRQFRFVNQAHDMEECQREVIRMMQLVRHLFFDSGELLEGFVEASCEASQMQSKTAVRSKRESQVEKLMSLFGQIIEELGT